MKLKKIGSRLIIPAAMCMILAGGVIPSFANNHSNSDFTFTRNPVVQKTLGRQKTDYTSSYIKCRYMTPGWSACVSVFASGKGGKCESVGSPIYGYKSGTEKYLANYVKEEGYSAAMLSSNPTTVSSGSYKATGSWSPDSI